MRGEARDGEKGKEKQLSTQTLDCQGEANSNSMLECNDGIMKITFKKNSMWP